MKKLIILLVGLIVFSAGSFADIPRFYGEEIVVTALRVPRLKSSIPWDTTVITREDIEDSTAAKIGDIIRTVPGVSVKANGGLSSQISARLRGSNSQQVLVLLNGNRINSPSLGTFDLGDILLTDVERIEIVKAPLSSLYGADAVGGVINIITRKATEKPEVVVSAGYGEYATRNLSVAGSGPNYFFSAAAIDSDGFRANSAYRAQDLNLRLMNGYFEAGIKKCNTDKGSPGSLDFLTPQARQSDKNMFYDLVYKADKAGLKATLSQATLDQKYENPTFAILSTHKTTSTNLNIQESIGDYVAGLEIRNDNSRSTNSGNHDLTNKAVYAQAELGPMVIGAREDITSSYGSHFNPRVGFVFNLRHDTLLKTSWGKSFKAPTIDDLYWSRLTEPGWPSGVVTTEGNPNLKPETSQSFDITLERKLSHKSSARLSYYVNQIKDMIRWTNTSTSTIDAFWTPTNISDADIQGIEFEYEKEIAKYLKTFINFGYQLAKDAGSGNFLDYAPQNQLNAGLKYRDPDKFDSNIVVRYVGERYTNLVNSTQLPSYTVVDLSLSKDFGIYTIKGEVENLFGESYAESYGFSDVYPMPGRRYNISVQLRINN
ncbi:MAG: TonB-dependent receptor [Candidatus Margulisiibacteriota bacterium]|nr:TonB-dependent receptor [Candidatus Margulisiibacteriota bacterium]